MMKTILAVVMSCFLVALSARNAAPEQEKADRKGMDIYLSYDQKGKVSKFTIKTNLKDATGAVPAPLKRDAVMAVIEEVIPEVERGMLRKQYSGNSNRHGYVETLIYDKLQIDLSVYCREGACGDVGYADIRPRQ